MFLERKQVFQIWAVLIRTKTVVNVLADYILDPGEVGRGAGEHWGLFVHSAANRTKASDPMNFPRTAHLVLTHQRTTWISLHRVTSRRGTYQEMLWCLRMPSPCLSFRRKFHLADRLELIWQFITTADHGGLDLEPPVIHPLAGVILHNRQGDLVKGLRYLCIHWITCKIHRHETIKKRRLDCQIVICPASECKRMSWKVDQRKWVNE